MRQWYTSFLKTLIIRSMAKQCILAVLLMIGSFTGMGQQQSQKEKGRSYISFCQRSFMTAMRCSGDLRGLMQKLPTCRSWVLHRSCCFPLGRSRLLSQLFHNDFDKIDPEFGTMEDYILLVKEIHKGAWRSHLDMGNTICYRQACGGTEALGQSCIQVWWVYPLWRFGIRSPTILADLRELNSYDGSRIKITTINLQETSRCLIIQEAIAYFVGSQPDGKLDDGVDGFRLDHCMDNPRRQTGTDPFVLRFLVCPAKRSEKDQSPTQQCGRAGIGGGWIGLSQPGGSRQGLWLWPAAGDPVFQ